MDAMDAAPAQLTIRLLGAPDVLLAGSPLLLHDQKARALLYYLAATGRPCARDYLANLLWSESFESNARHSLRSSLYHIRQALHARGADEVLVGDGDMISLKLNIEACDVTHFRQLLATGNESALVQAVTMYQGPLLRGYTIVDAPLFEEWLRAEEYELRQAYLITLQRLTALAESREEWQDTITYLQRIVQLDPLSEDMQRRLPVLQKLTEKVHCKPATPLRKIIEFTAASI